MQRMPDRRRRVGVVRRDSARFQFLSEMRVAIQNVDRDRESAARGADLIGAGGVKGQQFVTLCAIPGRAVAEGRRQRTLIRGRGHGIGGRHAPQTLDAEGRTPGLGAEIASEVLQAGPDGAGEETILVLMRDVDEDESGNLSRVRIREQPGVEAAERVADEYVRRSEVGPAQELVQLGDDAPAVAWPRSRVAVSKARAIVRTDACGSCHRGLNAPPCQVAVPEPRVHHDRRLALALAHQVEPEAADVNEFTGRREPLQVARRADPLIGGSRSCQERGKGGERPTEESGPAAGILDNQLNVWTAKATATSARTVTILPSVTIRAPAIASPA